jgi:hypothetical protein
LPLVKMLDPSTLDLDMTTRYGAVVVVAVVSP